MKLLSEGGRTMRSTIRWSVACLAITAPVTMRAMDGPSVVELGHLLGGRSHRIPQGISADGSVWWVGDSASGLNEAFRWTADGGMVGLGDLDGGGSSATRPVSPPTARSWWDGADRLRR